MPYLLSAVRSPHMSPSILELCDKVLTNPNGPEALGATAAGAADAAGVAPDTPASTGASMNSCELAGAGLSMLGAFWAAAGAAAGAAAAPPIGVSTNSPEFGAAGALGAAESARACGAQLSASAATAIRGAAIKIRAQIPELVRQCEDNPNSECAMTRRIVGQ